MQLLALSMSVLLGMQSPQPLLMSSNPVPYIDIEVGFEIAEFVFIRGSVNTYIKNSEYYGFAPFQADYTLTLGACIGEHIIIGFQHTCSHKIISSQDGNVKIWTGEKLYIEFKGKIPIF